MKKIYLASAILASFAFANPTLNMYKSESCGCCSLWAKHLEENGIKVVTHITNDPIKTKEKFKIPLDLSSCHTAKIGDFVIEGHVPAVDILELLESKNSDIYVLTAPGMPLGSPGMEQDGVVEDYEVLAIKKDGSVEIFSTYIDGKRYK